MVREFWLKYAEKRVHLGAIFVKLQLYAPKLVNLVQEKHFLF